MKQTILLLAFAALAAPMASAHGTDQHVMGTVTAMAEFDHRANRQRDSHRLHDGGNEICEERHTCIYQGS